MKIKKLSRLNFQNLGVRNFLSGSVNKSQSQIIKSRTLFVAGHELLIKTFL
jgi:hypothetical protein